MRGVVSGECHNRSVAAYKLIHVNERDATAWILEWNVIPQMLINTGTALNHAITISTKMKVNTANMKKNVKDFLKENPSNKRFHYYQRLKFPF